MACSLCLDIMAPQQLTGVQPTAACGVDHEEQSLIDSLAHLAPAAYTAVQLLMLHCGSCLQAIEYHIREQAETSRQPCRWVLQAPLTGGRRWRLFALDPDSNSMLQAGACFWANLPEDLLVSVFNAFSRPRDLLACACVCKAWRNGKAQAALPVWDLWCKDLLFLVKLNHVQLAAVRDVRMCFRSADPGCATASTMLLTFICCRLPMLQQLELDWGGVEDQEDLLEVGCAAADAYMICKLNKHAHCFLQMTERDGLTWQVSDFEMFCAILPSSVQALHFTGLGRASLPHLGHLTALTELRLDGAFLTPPGGQLPHLPALQALSLVFAEYTPSDEYEECPGPQDLGLAHSTPLLAELRIVVGSGDMSSPHEQLAFGFFDPAQNLGAVLQQVLPICSRRAPTAP